MDIHLYIHDTPNEGVISLLKQILKKESIIMATMNDLVIAIQGNTAIDEGVVILLTGLSQQLKDAQASNDPAALEAAIQQIDANTKKLSDAVIANTPAAPVA